jgi:hypothetical protein
MQHVLRLPGGQTPLDSDVSHNSWRHRMGLARPINALMICAAFAFIGALIMGFLP